MGGDFYGTRLNRLFLELVEDSELANTISKLIDFWKENKKDELETFGDFCNDQDFNKLKEVVGRDV